jgi:hypothetical protein
MIKKLKMTQINTWMNSNRIKNPGEWNKEENMGYERAVH